MTAPQVIVFDVDGVLVNVTASYREAIRETVRRFTGEEISNESIQEWKNKGGWNNDWDLCHRLVSDRGVTVTYNEVVEVFNRFFFGNNGDGLILREEWIPRPEFFIRLAKSYTVAIFTGRVGYELVPTIQRFASEVPFAPIVTADDVENQKPAPDGLLQIQKRYAGQTIWYLGDTVDDGRAAKSAGVPFIGIAEKSSPRYDELVRVLKEQGAIAVLDNVNELLGMLPEGAK